MPRCDDVRSPHCNDARSPRKTRYEVERASDDGYWGGGDYTDEEAVGKLRISLIVNDLWCKI